MLPALGGPQPRWAALRPTDTLKQTLLYIAVHVGSTAGWVVWERGGGEEHDQVTRPVQLAMVEGLGFRVPRRPQCCDVW